CNIAVLISSDSVHVARKSAGYIRHRKGVLLYFYHIRAPTGSNEKKFIVCCHCPARQSASSQRQRYGLRERHGNSIEIGCNSVRFGVHVELYLIQVATGRHVQDIDIASNGICTPIYLRLSFHECTDLAERT